jgi:uncharacterized membrane protein (UPF0127 family)
MLIVDLRVSCRRRGVRLTGALWLAASLPLYPTTSFPGAANLPAMLEYLELSKDFYEWKVIELQIPNRTGFVRLTTELADTEPKKERGLMFRQSLPENSGMLFIFDPPAQAVFWMKNTRIPLSIAFIDNQGRILEIRSMKPFDETLIWSVSNAVAYALEVNEGWFDRHGIQMGTRIFGIPSLSGKPERRANRSDPHGRIQARNEVRSGSFWTK